VAGGGIRLRIVGRTSPGFIRCCALSRSVWSTGRQNLLFGSAWCSAEGYMSGKGGCNACALLIREARGRSA